MWGDYMSTPKRINLELFEENLKAIINAAAKIFPINYDDILNNINPHGFEFGRVKDGSHKNEIYRWDFELDKWEIIGADDLNIDWGDIKNKPVSYTPSEHTHTEDQITNLDKYNKDKINQMISSINEALYNKVDLESFISELEKKLNKLDFTSHENNKNILSMHVTSDEKNLIITIENKADKEYVDSELLKKSSITHNHDGRYATNEYLNIELSNKEDKLSNRQVIEKITEALNHDSYDLSLIYDHEERLWLIENGYTEGHSHSNLDTLNKLVYSGTKATIDLFEIERTIEGILIELTNKAKANHIHNKADIIDLILDWEEISNKPLSYNPKEHTHNEIDIINLNKYTKEEIDNLLTFKANSQDLINHINNTNTHVTITDKENWYRKVDPDDLVSMENKLTYVISSTKPSTDAILWFEEL